MAKDSKAAIPDADRVALATFALLAADRQERAGVIEPKPVEQVLKVVGFTPNEIHALTGENLNTVKSRMYAAKKSKKQAKAKEEAGK